MSKLMIIALAVSILSVVVEIQPPSPTIMSDSDIFIVMDFVYNSSKILIQP